MAEVILFHHVQGLTEGCRALADEMRADGHVVHTPDLFDGRTFATIDEGMAHVEAVGFDEVVERGRRAAEALPEEVVYAGLSLGVVPAQMLTQTRPGARAAVLCHSCVPAAEFGAPWPEGVPGQVHIMEHDPLAAEGDLDAARELAAEVDEVELFLYPGERHLFADPGLPDYDAAAAALLVARVRGLLDSLG